MQVYKSRSEVPEEYKWDLTLLVKDENEYKKIVKEINVDLKNLDKFHGHLFDSSKTLLDYCKSSKLLEQKLLKIYLWSHLHKDEDLTNSKANEIALSVTNLINKVNKTISWVSPEIKLHDEKEFKSFLKEEPGLKEYAFIFENTFRLKKHILSEKEEKIITQLTRAYGKTEDVYEVLNNAEANLGAIVIDGEEINLTQTNYTDLLKDQNQDIRKNVFLTYYKFYKEHKNTIAALYEANINEDNNIATIRNFPNCLSMSLNSDNIDEKVYKNLLDSVNRHLPLIHEYHTLKSELLGLKEYHMYDLCMEVKKDKDTSFNINKCKEILFDALKPLKSDYLSKLEYMFNNKYIDYYPSTNKKSGAYQVCKYVLLNHLDTNDSLSTMAHELGHAINTLYTEEAQPFQYQENPIFLAEIASTFNEVLLNDYLYKNSKSKEEKIFQISEFLNDVYATIYRQTMFAEYESILHDKEQEGTSLTEEYMSNIYYDLNKKYFPKNMVIDDEIRYEWMRIPHFYTAFYVYKYAIGLICALIFAKRILNNEKNAVENYLKFLSSGSSDYPLNILKSAGIDLTKSEVFDEAFTLIQNKLKELKEVIKNG